MDALGRDLEGNPTRLPRRIAAILLGQLTYGSESWFYTDMACLERSSEMAGKLGNRNLETLVEALGFMDVRKLCLRPPPHRRDYSQLRQVCYTASAKVSPRAALLGPFRFCGQRLLTNEYGVRSERRKVLTIDARLLFI